MGTPRMKGGVLAGCRAPRAWTGCPHRPGVCRPSTSLLLEGPPTEGHVEGPEHVFYTAVLSRSCPIPVFVKKALGNIIDCETACIPVQQEEAQRGGHLVQLQEDWRGGHLVAARHKGRDRDE